MKNRERKRPHPLQSAISCHKNRFESAGKIHNLIFMNELSYFRFVYFVILKQNTQKLKIKHPHPLQTLF